MFGCVWIDRSTSLRVAVWLTIDLPRLNLLNQVLESRGGTILFDPGSLGGLFVGCMFIDDMSGAWLFWSRRKVEGSVCDAMPHHHC